MTYQLAECNVGRMRGPRDSAVMKEFMDALDAMNALADQSPGFVWRYREDNGNATSLQPYEDPMVIFNCSVWESVEALRTYTYRTGHARFFARRAEWFEKMEEAHLVLWWVSAGKFPTVEEARARLAHLREHGDSPHAFGFRNLFPPPAAGQQTD